MSRLLAIIDELTLRLGRVAELHSRIDDVGSAFDGQCQECLEDWPCETRKIAKGMG